MVNRTVTAVSAGVALLGAVVLFGCDRTGSGAPAPTSPTAQTSDVMTSRPAAAAEPQAVTAPSAPDEGEGVHATEEPAPQVVPGLAPTISPAEVSQEEVAAELVSPALEVQAEALSSPEEASWDRLATVAGESVLAAVRATVLEYENLGWSQVGQPAVRSAEVVGLDDSAQPPSVEVAVCLDYSDVDIVDAEGASLVDRSAPMTVLNLWTLALVDGRWVLVEQGFADDTEC